MHQVIARIESGLDQIHSLCQQLEQAEHSNQQLAQQLQSAQTDPNVRTQLQNMAQKENFNAQKLQQISQIASQVRQQVGQLRQQGMAAQPPQFQQPVGQNLIQAQSTQPVMPQFQQASQQSPLNTQEWVQRHAQTTVSPNQALNLLQQGVPQQGTQAAQTLPPVQTMPQPSLIQQPVTGQYRNQNPNYQH